MLMPITAEITYNEFLIDNPTFFDEKIEDGLIDEATVASIAKWFGKRIVCDDFNFDVFFDRQLDLVLPRYNKLIRLENTEFDAMVNAYRERQIVGTGSELQSNDIDKTISKEDELLKNTTEERTLNLAESTDETKTRYPDLEDNQTFNNVKNTTDYNSANTDTGKVDTTTDADVAGVAKQNPQSISYNGAAVGEVPNLDWQYPSAQNQSKTHEHVVAEDINKKTEHTGYDESTKTGSITTTHTGDERNVTDNDKTKTGTDTRTNSGTDTRTITGTDNTTEDRTKSTSDTIREQWTGRDNLTPQEALKSAMNYVKTSSAFAWLKDQLEVCFLSVYDI